MPEFRVRWEIELTAVNPVEAAKAAREIQLDPESTALLFDVADMAEDEDTEDFDIIDLEVEAS